MDDSKIITIDGPSGVGKGTLARALAKYLDYKVLDSGAIYRLAALQCLNKNTNLNNEIDVYRTVKNLDIKLEVENDSLRAFLFGINVSREIRTEEVSKLAAKIAAYSLVREVFLDKQRNFAIQAGLIADGRDMGTVVFPTAKYKFFLKASLEVRAKRRFAELKEKNQNPSFELILADIEKRDFQDRNRKIAPLKSADSAISIDTSDLTASEVFDKVISSITS